MNRKAELFFDAITLLREDLVEEAQNYVFRRKRNGWQKFASLAACLTLVLSLGLLVMPKGCGGAAPDFSGVSTDSCAPGLKGEPPAASEDTLYGDGTGSAGASPADTPSGEAEDPGQGGTMRFTAQVVEVLENGVLVEPLDEVDQELVRIPTAGLEGLPEFSPGDVVMVSCGSVSLEAGEAVAADVTEVALVQP